MASDFVNQQGDDWIYLDRLRAMKVPTGLATTPSSYHVPEYVSPSSVPSKKYTPSADPHPSKETENRKLRQGLPPEAVPSEQYTHQVLVPFGTAPKTQVPEVSVKLIELVSLIRPVTTSVPAEE